MFKYKGETRSFKKMSKRQDSIWYTYKDGEVVDEKVIDIIKSQNGEVIFEEEHTEPIVPAVSKALNKIETKKEPKAKKVKKK